MPDGHIRYPRAELKFAKYLLTDFVLSLSGVVYSGSQIFLDVRLTVGRTPSHTLSYAFPYAFPFAK